MLKQLFYVASTLGVTAVLFRALMKSRKRIINKDTQSSYLDRVCESCQNLQCEEIAKVDEQKVKEFIARLNIVDVRMKGGALASGGALCDFSHLNFESVPQEAGFITLLHALDFGSGFRKELHRACEGRGAYLTVKAGMSALFTSNPSLPASFLANMSDSQIGEYFQLPLQYEGKSSGLLPFVQLLGTSVREVGTQIQRLGFATMSDFVISTLRSSPRETRASYFVAALVDNFPLTFDDAYIFPGTSQHVYLYKKAQLVTGELYHRFRKETPLFDFGDGPCLTAFVDNVICATLRQNGVVKCCAELDRMIDQGEPLPRGSAFEVALRAKALAGVEAVVEGVEHSITSVELGNYLWAYLGKEATCRNYPRHATKDTCFY